MNNKSPVGVVGLFSSPDALLSGLEKIRDDIDAHDGWQLDAHTPYPVHGLSDALKLRRSPLGYLVLGGALFGITAALLLQGYTASVDYPLIIGGKPYFAWPAYVPIIFELMVLISAFTAFFGMLGLLNRLPFFGHPLLGSMAVSKITRDRFGAVIRFPANNPGTHEQAQRLLLDAGAESTEVLYGRPVLQLGGHGKVPFFQFGVISAVVLAASFAGYVWYWTIKVWPTLPPNVYMHEQNKLLPQQPSPFFLDRKGMREPPQGTVARGSLPYPYLPGVHDERAGKTLFNPIAFTEASVQRGRIGYENNCLVCHGALGQGDMLLSEEYLASPANLHSDRIRSMPDGQLFHVISVGKGTMPGYAPVLDPTERWEIVHYVRTLQRSQNASDEDLELALEKYTIAEAQPTRTITSGENS